ncbi:MAG: DUF2255 family protein, partial [Chloroflexi bacterium]|nr:DUF2255 family protein [Chloroflexota bacterium]
MGVKRKPYTKAKQRFSDDMLAAIRRSHVIGLRAGTQPHRFIAVWAVIVEKRVFVRSWSLKPNSWYHIFQREPRGAIQVDGHEIAVRAVRTRSERLKDAIDRAYSGAQLIPPRHQFERRQRIARHVAATAEQLDRRLGRGQRGKRRL